LWATLLIVFAAIFWLFLFLSWGMLQLGYVLPDLGLMLGIVGYVGTLNSSPLGRQDLVLTCAAVADTHLLVDYF